MSAGAGWTAALGGPGTIEVTELVRYDELGRRTKDRPSDVLELSSVEIAGRVLSCAAVGWRRLARLDGEVVATLDLERRRSELQHGGWTKPLDLGGARTRVAVRSEKSRGSRLRGPLHLLDVGDGDWCWHFVGGRAAGEQLVLVRGSAPGGDPVVTTFPAAQGRSLGSPRGGATADRHVTSWTAAAQLREVVLAELFATAKLDGLVDYRAARMAEGVQDLIGYVPRAEGNTA